jgi:hypothetical protein
MIDKQPVPRLVQAELLVAERKTNKILPPKEIPLHPTVYGFEPAFKLGFLERVRQATPEAVIQDLEAIKGVLGFSLGIELSGNELREGQNEIDLDRVRIIPSLRRNFFSVNYGSTNMSLGDMEGFEPRRLQPASDHPLSQEKLKAYAIDPDDPLLTAYRWDTNNLFDHGVALTSYMRNFAILFNNMALDEIERVHRDT